MLNIRYKHFLIHPSTSSKGIPKDHKVNAKTRQRQSSRAESLSCHKDTGGCMPANLSNVRSRNQCKEPDGIEISEFKSAYEDLFFEFQIR